MIPRDFWLEDWERQAIIDYYQKNPLAGYRRLTFMMLDQDIVAVSPSSVYRVLRAAGLFKALERQKIKKKEPALFSRLSPMNTGILTSPTLIFVVLFITCVVSWMITVAILSTTTMNGCTALLSTLPPRTNWNTEKRLFSKTAMKNLKQQEKQENKNDGMKNTSMPSTNEPLKGKLSTH